MNNRILGWGVPFVWAGIWAAITVPWVRSVMAKEKKSWEEDSAIVAEVKKETAPPAAAPGPMAEKASESSTLRGSTAGQQDESANGPKDAAKPDEGQSASRPPEGTTV